MHQALGFLWGSASGAMSLRNPGGSLSCTCLGSGGGRPPPLQGGEAVGPVGDLKKGYHGNPRFLTFWGLWPIS